MLYTSTLNLCDEFKFYGEITDETIAVIQQKFSWVTDKTNYAGISLPQYNEILQENTYITLLPASQSKILFNDEVILSARIFCMDSATSYVTAFKLPEIDSTLNWLPSSSKFLFKAKNYKEYGLPYPELADTYETYIFSGDSAQIESAFELSELRGTYDTYYQAIVINNEPVKIDRYCLNQENSLFNFDFQYLMLKKRLKRTDLQ